jgi:hypothetical protein
MLKFCGKPVPIRAGWAAYDAPVKIVTGMAGGILPWLVVGHWAFDAKEPLIIVGDDEKERRRRIGVSRGWVSNNS